VSTPELPEEQALLVQTAKGPVYIDRKVLDKITPRMARVIEFRAMDYTMYEIAEAEGIQIDGLNKRINSVHKILNVHSSIAAFRILVLAGIIIPK
jgi:DNA-binding CsgD family transcriptional regulator